MARTTPAQKPRGLNRIIFLAETAGRAVAVAMVLNYYNKTRSNPKMKAWLVCLAASALVLSSCSSAPPPVADTHDADVKAVTDDLAQWQKDFAAKDLDKIVAHYADDAVVINPGSPAVSGKEAAKAALKEFVADPSFMLNL